MITSILGNVNSWGNSIRYTVYIGFCDYGFSGQSGYSDRNPVMLTDLCHYIIATLDITTSNFRPYVAK